MLTIKKKIELNQRELQELNSIEDELTTRMNQITGLVEKYGMDFISNTPELEEIYQEGVKRTKEFEAMKEDLFNTTFEYNIDIDANILEELQVLGNRSKKFYDGVKESRRNGEY